MKLKNPFRTRLPAPMNDYFMNKRQTFLTEEFNSAIFANCQILKEIL